MSMCVGEGREGISSIGGYLGTITVRWFNNTARSRCIWRVMIVGLDILGWDAGCDWKLRRLSRGRSYRIGERYWRVGI